MEYIAHRGLSGKAPENTAAAFRLARERGFDWCELDVNVSADDQPVVWHDDNLKPFGHPVIVSRTPWSTLRTLDVGSWFSPQFSDQTLLSLQEALDLIQSLGMAINVELKPELAERLSDTFSDNLAATLNTASKQNRLLLSSFHPTVMNWCHQRCPDIPRALLVEGRLLTAHQQLAELTEAEALHLDDDHLELPSLKRLRDAGWAPRVYTVNDANRARQLAAAGCVGIFTDSLIPEEAD